MWFKICHKKDYREVTYKRELDNLSQEIKLIFLW